ncbi:MAG: hypothetical protein KatS3mg112_1841 [Thermogutta sp.]|nr:MAG: hypothetical protein KatS3mg112_1841 [Thermogutta sp.]
MAQENHATPPHNSAAEGNGAVRSGVRGIRIDPVFCPPDVPSPFDTVKWTRRTAVIKSDAGGVHFEQPDCEVPETWSQLATNIVASKYFYGELGTSAAGIQRAAAYSPCVPHDCRLGNRRRVFRLSG